MTQQEINDLNKLIESSDYPELLRELILKAYDYLDIKKIIRVKSIGKPIPPKCRISKF